MEAGKSKICRDDVPATSGRILSSSSGRILSYPGEGQAFCSIKAFNWLNEAHPHWGQGSALLSLPIQMLLSSKNILTEAPSTFDQIIKHPVAQSNWHIKIAIQKKKKKNLFSPDSKFQ